MKELVSTTFRLMISYMQVYWGVKLLLYVLCFHCFSALEVLVILECTTPSHKTTDTHSSKLWSYVGNWAKVGGVLFCLWMWALFRETVITSFQATCLRRVHTTCAWTYIHVHTHAHHAHTHAHHTHTLTHTTYTHARCAEEIATVCKQYPAEPFKFLEPRWSCFSCTLSHTCTHFNTNVFPQSDNTLV